MEGQEDARSSSEPPKLIGLPASEQQDEISKGHSTSFQEDARSSSVSLCLTGTSAFKKWEDVGGSSLND
jgi:hypothetical protein